MAEVVRLNGTPLDPDTLPPGDHPVVLELTKMMGLARSGELTSFVAVGISKEGDVLTFLQAGHDSGAMALGTIEILKSDILSRFERFNQDEELGA